MTDRAPLGFSETTFKWNSYSDIVLPVFNLGTTPLEITGYSSQTNRYSVVTPFPVVIAPGSKANITVRFSPKGEEMTRDTILLLNNDVDEPQAKLPVIGTGINYNFILNASLTGSEPHWNVPAPGGKFTIFGSYLNSTPTPWLYPITGGNTNSVVNTAAEPNTAVYYEFTIPDSLSGRYFIEYSGPVFSSNAAQHLTVDVVTPFYANPDPALADTQRVLDFNSRAVTTNVPWARIGGNTVFQLNPGDTTVVRYTNPQQGGTELLRADLLRVRLVPVAPTISTSLDPARILAYSPVSIYDSVRQAQLNFTRNIVIGSNGETPLQIDSLFLKSGEVFYISNLPNLPITLPAVDGKYDLRIDFLPDSLQSEGDSLIIVSNAPQQPRIAIRLNGSGVGTGITVDDTDPSIYISPSEIQQWTGVPDPNNMDKWYRVTGSGGNLDNRLIHYIYFNSPSGPETVEWFPNFPNKPGGQPNQMDYFRVYAQLSVGSSISS
ncbi:MAG: hypothetical protein HYV28_04710, partial [Ignavibacteriales bacterium]|nr:hypothetical protein [Ignavibacteriales bacterium]